MQSATRKARRLIESHYFLFGDALTVMFVRGPIVVRQMTDTVPKWVWAALLGCSTGVGVLPPRPTLDRRQIWLATEYLRVVHV